MKLTNESALIGVALLAGAGLIWWTTRPGVAAKLASGAVSAAADAATGVVTGIGEVVGIPQTNLTQCQQDIAAGRWWDASFSCPAGEYLAAVTKAAKADVFGSTALSASEAADARREYALTDPRRLDSGGVTGSW